MSDLSLEARTLLDRARTAHEPTPADEACVQRMLEASLAAGIGVASGSLMAAATKSSALGAGASGASGTLGAAKIALWMGVGALAGTVGMGAVVVTTSRVASPTDPARVAPAVQAPAVLKLPASAMSPAPVSPAVAAEAQPEVPTPTRVAPGPRVAALDPPALTAETQLLGAAGSALAAGDARRALSLLERHEREFPHGSLVEERLAAKVFALCAMGRRAEAAGAAGELLRRAPTSPLRGEVMGSCAYR